MGEPAALEPSFQTHISEHVRCLGRGSFGEVSLVQVLPPPGHETLKGSGSSGVAAFAALKQVSLAHFSEAATESAVAEARLLKNLGSRHGNILRCFDFRLSQGGVLPVLELLLEFAQFGDLNRRINACRAAGEKGFPQPEVVVYMRDVAAGLTYIHGLCPKVLHRDVKPANIVLCHRDEFAHDLLTPVCAKLADFGIAKVLEYDSTFSGAATVIGTPHYFSPEMCRGEHYDERADAWGLGCVLYEMICLLRPFHRSEGKLAILAMNISEGDYDKELLLARAFSYHEALISLLRGLLACDPRERLRARDASRALQTIWTDIQGNPDSVMCHLQPLDTTSDEMARPDSRTLPVAGVGTEIPVTAALPLPPNSQRPNTASSSIGLMTALLRDGLSMADTELTTLPPPGTARPGTARSGTAIPSTARPSTSATIRTEMLEETTLEEESLEESDDLLRTMHLGLPGSHSDLGQQTVWASKPAWARVSEVPSEALASAAEPEPESVRTVVPETVAGTSRVFVRPLFTPSLPSEEPLVMLCAAPRPKSAGATLMANPQSPEPAVVVVRVQPKEEAVSTTPMMSEQSLHEWLEVTLPQRHDAQIMEETRN